MNTQSHGNGANRSVPRTRSSQASSLQTDEHIFSVRDSRDQHNLVKNDPENQSEIETCTWDGPNDSQNPQNFSVRRKVAITAAALVGTLVLQLNGTSITVATNAINAEFGVSDAHFLNSYWTVTSWVVGGAIFVLMGMPLLEDLGVRFGFLAFYAFFILMVIPQALAQNFATLIVTRFLSGGCATLLANIASSVIPDVWANDRTRSTPVGLYILFYLAGATLGPPVFAGVMQHIGNWRWIFYLQLIIYSVLFPFFWWFLEETRTEVILKRRAKKLRTQTGIRIYAACELSESSTTSRLARSMYRPLYLQCTEPVMVAFGIWSAFSTGTIYVFTQSVGQVYTGLYGWQDYSTGYVQIAVVIGEIIGWLVSFYGTHLYFQSTKRNHEMPGKPIPEARLYVSIFTSFVGLSGGIFLYAWTAYPDIPWIAPTIGLAMVGCGITSVVIAVADYLVDAYSASGYAGSAVGAVAASENLVSAFLPLATLPMYTNLGYNWASTLLALIALLLSFAPVIIVWKGRSFRERSPFMLSAGKSWLD